MTIRHLFLGALGACLTRVVCPQSSAEARIVLATSGGISLGSYQAGVAWGLIEPLRLSQTDDSLRSLLASSGQALPRLVGLSGASAGTINSLMSAIHYCTAGPPIPPEASLFWRTWVDVGWRQLMPHGARVRVPELGLIDREYFESVLLGRLRRALAAPGRAGCALPVAGSLTKQRAVSEQVFDHVSIAVQRHVGSYALRTDSLGRMTLTQASPVLRNDLGVGLQIALAPGATTDTLRIDQVFDLARASSSIPFAFAPVQLRYYRANALDSAGVCPPAPERRVGCAAPEEARFLDGGAFDNRPISIADRLLLASRTEDPPARPTTFHTVFIVPTALRQGDRVTLDTVSERVGGTLAATQFLGSMWRSAAEYELHAYARMRSGDPDRHLTIADTVEVTSRAHPIFGETLAHFGAFLARPFREYDFYVGLYDALNFHADRLCGGVSSPGARSQTEVKSICHVGVFHRLLHHVQVGCTGHLLVERLYRSEYRREVADAALDDALCAGSMDERRRNAMLVMIADAFAAVRAEPPHCKESYNAFETLMCSSGMSAFAARVRQLGLDDSVRRHILSRGECRAEYARADSASAACFADDYLRRFIQAPHDFLKRLTFLGLQRAAAIERVAQRTEGVNYSDARLGLANPVLRAMFGGPSAAGFTWDQSSTPRECDDGNLYPKLGYCSIPQTFFRFAVPYYLAGGFGSTLVEAGVRPAYHQDAETSIVFPLSLHHGRVDTRGRLPNEGRSRRTWLAGGVGVMWRNHTLALNECLVSTSVRARAPWAREVIIPEHGRFLHRIQCDLFASRFTVGLSTTRFVKKSEPWSLVVGLSDFNGLLYWLLPHGASTNK